MGVFHGQRILSSSLLFLQRPSSSRRLLVNATSLVLGAALLGYYWPELKFFGETLRRASRTAVAVSQISFDYKQNFPSCLTREELGEALWRRARDRVHERAAAILLQLFQRNGGIYIKVGQHLSALEYILPKEYCSTMTILYSQAPTSTLPEVSQVVREDLGENLSIIFSEFDPVPIGAASLAQVHRARLRITGEEVAVKIQHLKLKYHMDVDIFVISLAVKAVKWLFPEFDLDWVADEIKLNLPRELDFVNEAHNSERVLRNFRQYHRIPLEGSTASSILRIPKVFWSLTTKRILTMEYLPGAKATDRSFLKNNGIDPQRVSEMITRIFSEMIFMHGFVHCDPHPGNLLIRPRPPANNHHWYSYLKFSSRSSCPFELVLIDHGLYRELPDEFRHNYAGLWKAVIDADEIRMKYYAECIGGGDAYRLFSCILTQRAWQTVASGRIITPQTAIESAEIMAKAPEYLSKVAELLARVPRPLLLLLKTNDLLRHLERSLVNDLKVPPRTFIIMSHYCVDALFEDRHQMSKSVPLWNLLQHYWAHLRIYFLDFLLSLS